MPSGVTTTRKKPGVTAISWPFMRRGKSGDMVPQRTATVMATSRRRRISWPNQPWRGAPGQGCAVGKSPHDEHAAGKDRDGDGSAQNGAEVRLTEGVHRGDNHRAGQEGAEQAEVEGDHRDDHRCQPQTTPTADAHAGVEQDRAGEPRQQGRILDRVPCPVPAPAQLGVGPAGAQNDAKGERNPRITFQRLAIREPGTGAEPR